MERIELAAREQEAAARMKRVKKSIWHFTISLKRRALLGRAWQVLLATALDAIELKKRRSNVRWMICMLAGVARHVIECRLIQETWVLCALDAVR